MNNVLKRIKMKENEERTENRREKAQNRRNKCAKN